MDVVTWEHLHTPEAASLAAFGIAIVDGFRLQRPLSSLFDSAITGCFFAYGAEWVHYFFPKKLTPVIPIACYLYILQIGYKRATHNTGSQEESKCYYRCHPSYSCCI